MRAADAAVGIAGLPFLTHLPYVAILDVSSYTIIILFSMYKAITSCHL